jgi:hypothetical protein
MRTMLKMTFPLHWIDFEKLREIPSRQSPFKISNVVDLLELWCVSSIDKEISTSQLINFFDDDLAIIEDDKELEVDMDTDISGRMKKEEFFNFVHIRLKYRRDTWGRKWPFAINVSRNNITIKYLPNEFTVNYLAVLFCSNLHLVKESTRPLLTTAFELVSFQHLASIHSNESGWITKAMGANTKNIHTYLGSTPKQKMEALGQDLCCSLNPNYRPTTSGDGGIDLVSFLKFGDSRASGIVFGQCACTNDKRKILDKISETSPDSIRDKIIVDTTPLNYLYSPLDLKTEIRPSGFDLDGLRGAIVIDRTRILLRDFDFTCVIDSTLRSNIYGFIYLRENYYEAA